MKRAPEQSSAGPSAPAAQRLRTNPPLNAASPAQSALEAVKMSTAQALEASTESTGAKPGAPVDPGALAAFLDARHAARRDCQTLEKELQALGQDLAAEVTVLNINAAMLLEKKGFLLQGGGIIPAPGLSGWSPTVGGVLEAIWARVDRLVQQCKYEEGRAAANAEGVKLPVLDADTKKDFQGMWWDFLKNAREYTGPPTLPVWIAREWTGVAGTEGEEASVSLELLPATKGVYRLAGCGINDGGEMIAILVADRSEVQKIKNAQSMTGDLLLPTSCFLSRAAFNVVFAVRMDRDGEWRKVYAGDLATVSPIISSRWLSTFPGQEQYDCQREKDVAATHERFPGFELGEVREKILIQRDLHRLGWSVSSRNNEPEAHVLTATSSGFGFLAELVDTLLTLLQKVEKATQLVPDASTTGVTAGAPSDLFLRLGAS